MGLTVLWCDEWMRLDPVEGAALDGEEQAPDAPPVRASAVRGGTASFQLLAGPVRGGAAATVSVGRLAGPARASLGAADCDVFCEWYHRDGERWCPDALVPQAVTGGSTPALRRSNGVRGQRFAGFWVDVSVPDDARPGSYSGKLTVRCGRESAAVPVEIEVLAARIGPDCALDMSFNNYADGVSAGWPEIRRDPRHMGSARYLRAERGVWRAMHEHRGFMHYMPYGHSGYVHQGFTPPVAGEGRGRHIVSWTDWDRHFGPYFDGSAFRGTRRGAVPVKRFYLPLNLCWPADFVKFGQPGYEAEWRAVGRQMVEHFRGKGWTGTRFDLFLNHKQRFRFFPWDCEECRFLPDNEIHRYFRKLWAGTFDRKSTLPVKFDYTLGTTWTYDDDIHSDISEFVDVYIAGTGGPAENPERGAELARAGRQIWSCTRCGTIADPPRATAYTPLLMWMRRLQGFMPAWASMMWGGDVWHATPALGGTTFFYPGAEFGTEDTYPSLRAKLLRNQLQWVDAMEAAAGRLGPARVRARVNAVLGTRPAQWFLSKARRKSADWGSEERPMSGWKDVPTAKFRRLRRLSAELVSGR